MIQESDSFIDYQVRKSGFLGGKPSKIGIGDIITDEFGFVGIVQYSIEGAGNFLEFMDGRTGFESDLKLKIKKLGITNLQFFEHQRKYFGRLGELGMEMKKALESHFPFVNVFFNGKAVIVRASTMQSITKKFTSAKISDSHSFISFVMTPFNNVEIQKFDVKISKRSSRFQFDVLRDVFKSVTKVRQASKFRFIVNDSNYYNKFEWLKIEKSFSRLNIKIAKD